MMHMSIDTPSGASKVIIEGTLELIQQAPVLIDSMKRTLYNKNPLDDYTIMSMPQIMEAYEARKEKT